MPTWPGTLPSYTNFLPNTYTEGPPDDNRLRTPMDVGQPKMRRRASGAPRPFGGDMYMTTAQLATLDTFYVTTLSDGVTAFDWYLPRTAAAITARFVTKPTYRQMGLGWRVTLKMESV